MSGTMCETGSRFVKYSRRGVLGVLALAGLCMMRPAAASGQVLIESFEGTLDGWTFNPSFNHQNYTQTFSTTTGVTNGTQSLEIDSGTITKSTPLAGFNYGNLLISPRTASLASLLSTSSAVTFDFFAPSGALGYGPQIDLAVDDGSGVVGGTGFQSFDGYSYPTPANGSEVTISYPISATLQSELAVDAASTGVDLVLQIGSGTPNAQTIPVLFVDNVEAVTVPEPATLSLLGLGASALLIRRRKAM